MDSRGVKGVGEVLMAPNVRIIFTTSAPLEMNSVPKTVLKTIKVSQTEAILPGDRGRVIYFPRPGSQSRVPVPPRPTSIICALMIEIRASEQPSRTHASRGCFTPSMHIMDLCGDKQGSVYRPSLGADVLLSLSSLA